MMGRALLLIDIQQGLEPDAHWGGARNNPDAEDNARALLAAWRAAGAPVVVVQHASTEPNSPLRPERPGFALKDGFEPAPGEKHIVKHTNSAFIGTDLEQWLRDNAIGAVTICGLITEHCVSTTARMAANLGFAVDLIADACHAHAQKDPFTGEMIPAETVHQVELAILNGEFARVTTTAEALALAQAE